MNTRRYPRTMQEAFGPYVDNHLLPMQEPRKPLRAVRFLSALVSILKHRKVHL
jgi:hypothetical protein